MLLGMFLPTFVLSIVSKSFFQKHVFFKPPFFLYERKTSAMAQTDERGVFAIPTTSEKTEDGETYVVTNSIILSFTKMSPLWGWKIKKIDGLSM